LDAIQKLKMVSRAGEHTGDIGEAEIQISIDKDKDPVDRQRYRDDRRGGEKIQVAFSSAEPFRNTKQNQINRLLPQLCPAFTPHSWWRKKVEMIRFPYKEGSARLFIGLG